MNLEVLQAMIDIVFKGNLLILSPVLLILMMIIFSEQLIGLIYKSVGNTDSGRRSRN